MKLLKKIKQAKSNSQGGFTLIELLVVIGILAILLAITLIAINPNKHFEDVRNTQRSSNVGAILDAIYEYESSNTGNIPPALSSLTSTPTELSSSGIDLCSNLVPTYLAQLPTDPKTGTVTGGGSGAGPCSVGVTSYDTGYQISESNGRFTVSAPAAEDGQTISVTR